MSGPTSITTAFERARRYQELSQAVLRATGDAPTLQADCPPYEAQYGKAHLFQQSQELADIAGFYKACGLAAPAKERVDHLAVELEFMSFLALKEAYALHDGAPDRAAEVRDMQRQFLTEHLARWAPAFATRFEERDASLANGLRDWIAAELGALGAEPASVRAMDLRPAGEVEEGFECGGGSCVL
jgi:TorA maturation chaperone TorD